MREQPDLEALIHEHTGMITKLALGYALTAELVEFDDLMQEGRIGVCDAAKRYDASFSCKFSSYAFLHIRGRMLKLVGRTANIIQMPRGRLKNYLPVCSLDEVLTVDGDVTRLDVISAECDDGNVHVARACDASVLSRALAELPDMHREVLQLRYFQDQTCLEAASGLDMSRQRVNQIEHEALNLLQKAVN